LTSVIGGCVDNEFATWSNLLFEEFRRGIKVAVVSDLTRRELEVAPKNVQKMLFTIPESNLENVFLAEEAEKADRNIFLKELKEKYGSLKKRRSARTPDNTVHV